MKATRIVVVGPSKFSVATKIVNITIGRTMVIMTTTYKIKLIKHARIVTMFIHLPPIHFKTI